MESYYPNACYVCKAYGKNVALQRCARCGLIAYCSETHRKVHWVRHKFFCRAVCDIINHFGTKFKFIRRYRLDKTTSLQLSAEKYCIMVKNHLGRDLTYIERLSLLRSRSCNTCHEENPKKLEDCPDCPSGTFCLKHLTTKEAHAEKCAIEKFRCDLDRLTCDISPWTTLDHKSHTYGDKTPENMENAIAIYDADYKTMEKLFSKTTWETLLTEKLTNPYTFLHAMDLLSVTFNAKMTIHIIDVVAVNNTIMDYWQILLHHVASLQELYIVLIGSTLENESRMLECCAECKEKKRFVSLQVVSGNYADFAVGQYFSKPDCVMGFNVGIEYRFPMQTNTWTLGLETIAQLGCPFFVTSVSNVQSNIDKENINTILEKIVQCHYSGPNPFAALRPFEGSIDIGEYLFSNLFLNLYKQLS